jgi:transposase
MPHARKEPAVEHIGIDLGAKHSHVAIVGANGELFVCRRIPTERLKAFFAKREPSMVVMEACTQSRAVSRMALAADHEVRVVPGQLVRALGVGARGIKTDERDAQCLALASARVGELQGVHLRSDESVSRKELLTARQALVSARSSLAATCKSWLRGRLLNVRGRASSTHFAEAFRRLAASHDEPVPVAIATLLEAYEDLCGKIESLDAELESVTKCDPVVERLMSMPGVGPVVATAFKAHVDDPNRFASSAELGSYLALVPGEATTGGKIKRTGTIRAGCRYLKSLLVQAAWSMWRCRPNDPLVAWARALAERRGKRIAIVALARKISYVLWAMWKNEAAYDPSRASTFRVGTTLATAA